MGRLLSESISEWFTLFCLCHKLTIGFAVVAVINGVLMQETFKVASTDDRLMATEKEKSVRVFQDKMYMLFREMDTDGGGTVTLDEFRSALSCKKLMSWLASMDL